MSIETGIRNEYEEKLDILSTSVQWFQYQNKNIYIYTILHIK